MIPVTPCPLRGRPPSRGWHVTYITTPVLFIPGPNHFQSRSQCKRLSGKMPLGERFSAQRLGKGDMCTTCRKTGMVYTKPCCKLPVVNHIQR